MIYFNSHSLEKESIWIEPCLFKKLFCLLKNVWTNTTMDRWCMETEQC